MKEISRIVVGITALRLVEENGVSRCERFENGNWTKLTPTKLQELSFDRRIQEWLDNHYHSDKDNVLSFYAN